MTRASYVLLTVRKQLRGTTCRNVTLNRRKN